MANNAEHLVRWKFKAGCLLNRSETDTLWYEQFHPNKDEAITHYISLLRSGEDGIVVEIFRLTKLKPS